MSPHFLIIREAHCRPSTTTIMTARAFDLSHATNILCTASNEELLNSNRIHQVYQRLQDIYRSGRFYPSRSLWEEPSKLPVDRVSLDDPTVSRPCSPRSGKATRQAPKRGRKPTRRQSSISLSSSTTASRFCCQKRHTSAPPNFETTLTYTPKNPTGICKQILDRLQRNYTVYKEFSDNEVKVAIEGSQWKQLLHEDFRIADLVFVEGCKSKSAIFRATLARRDLAKQFEAWERASHQESRVDQLVKDLDTSKRGNRRMASFARQQPFRDVFAAQRGIQFGIKLLVIERLLGFTGISALLAFLPELCWRLKYQHIADFVMFLHDPRWANVLELSQTCTSWFERCETAYSEQGHSGTMKRTAGGNYAEPRKRQCTTFDIPDENLRLHPQLDRNLTETRLSKSAIESLLEAAISSDGLYPILSSVIDPHSSLADRNRTSSPFNSSAPPRREHSEC